MKRIFKRNIYLLFGLTALCSGIIGCDDRIDDSVSPVSGQELVTVPLSFGFAEESFGELYRNGRCVKTKAHLLFLYLNVFFLYATLFSLIW